MDYLQRLISDAQAAGSIVCLGVDPDLDRIAIRGEAEYVIMKFFKEIMEAVIDEGHRPAAVKPNYAYFAQYGFPGLKAMKKLIDDFKTRELLVILDAKRGDIGKSGVAYAKEVFEFWTADAVTISPYMGLDSIAPFAEYCKSGRGIYILGRTSNAGAKDLQDLHVNHNGPFYLKVADLIVNSNRRYGEGVGAVVGATSVKDLKRLSKYFVLSGRSVPLLIPGIGAQGGSTRKVVSTLWETGNRFLTNRLASSSDITYAYQKKGVADYAGEAVKALRKLNSEVDSAVRNSGARWW